MYDILIINNGNTENILNLTKKYPFAKIIDKKLLQIDTIKSAIKQSKTRYCWIVDSSIDYRDFQFDYIPEPWEADHLHCWKNYNLNNVDTILLPMDRINCLDEIDYINQFPNFHLHEVDYCKLISYNKKHIDLDIFYLSNGESLSEINYKFACENSGKDVKWIKNINGRTEAIKFVAEQSNSDYFYLIPAKLKLDKHFDWAWQPDYYSNYKHYIFNALNPVNSLVYGHMGMIAYNKKLVLETDNPGLDFTLSKATEVVDMLSGEAQFNNDPKMTWRTAFREVIKLQYFSVILQQPLSSDRLDIWKTIFNGTNAEWCKRGVEDAIQYFNSVNGDYNKLLYTYHWAWLDEFQKQKGYNL
jgi:hypothetical protein